MEIRILLDITDKLEKALRRMAFAIVAGGGMACAKEGTAQNQDVPAENAPKDESAPKDDAPKPEPKKRARAKKPSAHAVEISTPAAMVEGGKDEDVNAESHAEAEAVEPAADAEPEQAPENKLFGVYGVATQEQAAPEPAQENEDELGKGAVGEIISELTGRLINRMNEEARDKATINRNLRAKCEELQLKFPTVPALIQAIGYGNAYKACIGEG